MKKMMMMMREGEEEEEDKQEKKEREYEKTDRRDEFQGRSVEKDRERSVDETGRTG